MSSVKTGEKMNEKGSRKRNRAPPASHKRLQSEFGWQASLQARKVDSAPSTVPESEEEKNEQAQAVSGDTSNADEVEESAQETPEPEPIPVEELKPLPTHRKDKSDTGSTTSRLSKSLAKKDFGWQLALRENIGSITPKSSHLRDTQPDSQQIDGLSKSEGEEVNALLQVPSLQEPPMDAKSAVKDPDANAKDVHRRSPSGSSSTQLEQPFPKSESRRSRINLEEQLRNPVRGEFGWQLGLASRSLTLPLSQPSRLTPVADDPNATEFGASVNNAALASRQSVLYDTDWGLVGGLDGPSNPAVRFGTRAPPAANEFSLPLCFGDLSTSEAWGVEGGVDHMQLQAQGKKPPKKRKKGKKDQGNQNAKSAWSSTSNNKATGSMHQGLKTSEEAQWAPFSMKWETFLKLMRERGFEYDLSNAGSAVRFNPPNPKHKSITIHKPHPDSTLGPVMLRQIGKRLKNCYGWDEEDFFRQAQERAGK